MNYMLMMKSYGWMGKLLVSVPIDPFGFWVSLDLVVGTLVGSRRTGIGTSLGLVLVNTHLSDVFS